jgi:hypothetical protein
MPEKRGRYDRLEPARRLFQVIALNARESLQDDKSDKDLEEKPKFALNRKPQRFVYRLLIHVISLGLTLGVVQLSFRGVYWFDIGAAPTSFITFFSTSAKTKF